MVVRILEAYNFERDVVSRAKLLPWNLICIPTLFLALKFALDGLKRLFSITTDATAVFAAVLVICVRHLHSSFERNHSLLWFFIFINWVHFIIHSYVIFVILLFSICLQVPLWLLPRSFWVDRVESRVYLLSDVRFTRWLVLVDEKPYYEARLILNNISLFECFFQS